MPDRLGRRDAALGLALPLLLLAAWWYATTIGGIKVYQLASPAGVLRELGTLAASGELWKNLVASIVRVAFGFAIALVLAIGIGTSVGLSARVERLVDPTLQALRAIPSLAWVPLLLLWLGIGETAKIVLIAIGAFFPIYVNLVAGIRGVDRKLVEVAEVFGIRGFALARRVVIPAALPSLLVGARIGLTQAWLFLVAAELLGATRGLGFLLTEGQQISRTDEILTAIVLLAICGKLSESAMRAVERRMLFWTDGISS
ncbi:MAG: ABC transporter permease, partial [Candidatus Eremiobacteraeota bacterium]|nr:ABC transporter permease [Candidatus Eremiobacteraeota bacterium]